MKDRKKGILFILGAAFFFALMNLFVKLGGDVPTMQKAFFRNAVATLAAVIVVVRQRGCLQSIKGNLGGLSVALLPVCWGFCLIFMLSIIWIFQMPLF